MSFCLLISALSNFFLLLLIIVTIIAVTAGIDNLDAGTKADRVQDGSELVHIIERSHGSRGNTSYDSLLPTGQLRPDIDRK